MFTGLIEEVGIVKALQVQKGNSRLTIEAKLVTEDLHLGDSIDLNGVCLTVTNIGVGTFIVEASAHTARQSTIHNWKIGRRVNLERALKVGDRLGGHIVQGHVDGVGRVARIRYGEGSTDIYVETDNNLMKLMAPRGSVTVDGVSLTLAGKSARSFKLMVIPYTLHHTTLGDLKPGQEVNLETDVIIRWLADRFKDGEITEGKDFMNFGDGPIHLED